MARTHLDRVEHDFVEREQQLLVIYREARSDYLVALASLRQDVDMWVIVQS